jgi:hypothetical protein
LFTLTYKSAFPEFLVSVGVFCHLGSVRAPPPMPVHPSTQFVCYAPSQLGERSISPGQPQGRDLLMGADVGFDTADRARP